MVGVGQEVVLRKEQYVRSRLFADGAFHMRKLATIGAIALTFSCGGSPFAQSAQPEGLKTIDELVRDAHEGVTFIRSDALKARIKANKKLVLLDVRTAVEYEAA